MRVAILGSSGLLGAFFGFAFDQWFEWEVTLISRGSNLRNGRHIPFYDLAEVPGIILEGRFDIVVNCIAMASHEGCEIDSHGAFKVNGEFPGYLAASCTKSGSRLIHVSTDAVFDGPHEEPFTEEDAPKPLSVYGLSKLQGEEAVAREDPNAVILRTNFFGWSSNGSKGVLDFFYSALRQGASVDGFTDYRTSSLYVGDLAEIVRDLVRVDFAGVIHAVSAEALSKFDFGRGVANVFGFDASIIRQSSLSSQNFMAHRAHDLALSPAKCERILERKAPTALGGISRAKHGMQEYWDFLGRH